MPDVVSPVWRIQDQHDFTGPMTPGHFLRLNAEGTTYELAAVSVPVTSIFGRTGDVVLTSADVTGALGYVPPSSVPTSGVPTGTVGLAAVNGSADTFMRSDGAPALSQAITPTWTGAHVWAPTASGAVAGTFRASTTSPGNIANFAGSGGTVLTYVNSSGQMYLGADQGNQVLRLLPGGSISYVGTNLVTLGFTGRQVDVGGTLRVMPQVAVDTGLTVQGAASQSANLIEVKNSSGTVQAGLSPIGGLFLGSTTLPESGVFLYVTGGGGTWSSVLRGSSTAGNSFGLKIRAGTNSSDAGLRVYDQSQTSLYFEVRGDGRIGFGEACNLAVGTTTGTKLGTATTQKLGFWNATPVVQPVLATGAGATADDIIGLLQTLGLCRQS